MLDLQPGVDLEKIKFVGLRIENEFNRAGVLVARGGAEARGTIPQALALCIGQAGRGSFLDDFLVAALRGTVAFAERDDVAEPVAENLHFNVARLLHVFFKIDAPLLEVVAGEAVDGGERVGQLAGGADELHADAPSSGGALEHHGVADARRFAERVVGAVEQLAAGQQRHAVGFGERSGGVLEAKCPHLGRGRPDENNPRARTGLGKRGIFTQKP